MKKISANKWSRMLEKKSAISTVTKIISGQNPEQTLEVEIMADISTKDRMSFAKSVCEACFDEVDGSYIPYAKEISFKIYLVNYFTNIDIGKDTEKILRFIADTDIISAIIGVIGNELADAIRDEVEDLISQEKARRAKSTKAEELFDALTQLIEGFSFMADKAKDGLEDGSIPELAKVMNAFNYNEEGIVKAILEVNKDKK
jgi:hypothetical protein